MFVLTYGFPFRPERNFSGCSYFIPKAVCFDRNAEIHRVGSIVSDERPTSTIWLLVWEEKAIPFIQRPDVHITDIEKDILIAGKHRQTMCLPVSAASILLTNIGEDLVKQADMHGRDLHYDRRCFLDADCHGYAFKNQEEYLQAVALMKEAMAVMLWESAGDQVYAPVMAMECLTDREEEESGKADSVYRKHALIDRCIENASQEEQSIARMKRQCKDRATPLQIRQACQMQVEQYEQVCKTARKSLAMIKKQIKTPAALMDFLVQSVKPPSPQDRTALYEVFQRHALFSILLTSGLPIWNDYCAYKEEHIENMRQAARSAAAPVTYTAPQPQEIEKEFAEVLTDAKKCSIEYLMWRLLVTASPFYSLIQGATARRTVLRSPAFYEALQASVAHSYQNVFPRMEDWLITVTEAVTLHACRKTPVIKRR